MTAQCGRVSGPRACELLSTIFETNLSMQDHRRNNVMRNLAGCAAIISVPTAVSGCFGQNVPVRIRHGPGVWVSMAMMGVMATTLRGLPSPRPDVRPRAPSRVS
jgi:magnesium transporter